MPVLPKILIIVTAITLFGSSCAGLDQQRKGIGAAAAAPDSSDNLAGRLASLHDTSKANIAWLLQYYRLISTIPIKVLNDEFERTKNDYAARKTPRNQWQLALLLSLPAASFYDPGRSAILFRELAGDNPEQDPTVNDAAFLMYSMVNEQHQIGKKLDEAQAANKTMQDKLDALKAIESTLYERNKAEVKSKP